MIQCSNRVNVFYFGVEISNKVRKFDIFNKVSKSKHFILQVRLLAMHCWFSTVIGWVTNWAGKPSVKTCRTNHLGHPSISPG